MNSCVNGGEIGRRLGKIAVEAGPHLVRDRLPDRTVADVLDVIENVVEHPVRLGPERRPIGRVERSALSNRRVRAHIVVAHGKRHFNYERRNGRVVR